MHDRIRGRGQHYPNFLLIRTVRNFHLAKGVRITEVGLYDHALLITYIRGVCLL
jgi:hypothetical protein